MPRVLALGRDGRIWLANSGAAPRTERIADAGTGRGKYGYLSRVRQIAGQFYICGDQGQVYVRRGSGWQHMDRGLLHPRRTEGIEYGLNGIDGTAPDDIYVVGDAGAVFHFDGTRWEDVGIDTSLDLESVRCVSRDIVHVCGGMGTLLTGNRQGWRLLAEGETEDNLWDLEMFGGRLYLAANSGLLAYDATGDAIVPVDTGLSPKPDGHRLSTNVRELWSMGGKSSRALRRRHLGAHRASGQPTMSAAIAISGSRSIIQIAEDAAFLWLWRDVAARAPNIRLIDLVRRDERLDAHGDALGVAGEKGWQLVCAELPVAGAGAVFSAFSQAMTPFIPERVEHVVNIATANDAASGTRAGISALARAERSSVAEAIAWMAHQADPLRRGVAIGALGARRSDPGAAVVAALADGHYLSAPAPTAPPANSAAPT